MEHIKEKKDRFPIFKERFRELQGEMSNTEFADFLGMSRQTVGFYLNGNRVPDIIGLEQISSKCNVSADWLLGLSESKLLDAEIQQICHYTGLSENAVMHLNMANCSYPSLLLELIDDLAVSKEVDCASKYLKRAAMAALRDKNATRPTDVEIEYEMLVDSMDSSSESHDGMIRIPTQDAILWYVNKSMELVSNACHDAIERTVNMFIRKLEYMKPIPPEES